MTAWVLAWAWWVVEPGLTSPPVTLSVPRVDEVLTVDGHADESFWTRRAARTGAFVDGAGLPARPFSEVHFAWDAAGLRLLFYAADADITARDVFRVAVTLARWRKDFFVTPRALTTAEGVAIPAGFDCDGSIDDPHGDDEEWIVEWRIPWEMLGVSRARPAMRLDVAIDRVDTGSEGASRRASWATPTGRGALVLAP